MSEFNIDLYMRAAEYGYDPEDCCGQREVSHSDLDDRDDYVSEYWIQEFYKHKAAALVAERSEAQMLKESKPNSKGFGSSGK